MAGLTNWKKALQKFSEHQGNDTHHEATDRLAAKNSGVHIGAITSDLKAAEIAFHRTMLMNVLSGIKYLELALWGHDERADSFEGNIYQLLLLEAKGDCKMKAWL